jgi:hypothetical protein
MNRPRFRLQAMPSRCLVLSLSLASGVALAQSEDLSLPPMVSADEDVQPAPQPGQQQPYPGQPQPQNQQPYDPNQQQPQYQQPYPNQQQPQYQQPYPNQQQPQYQQPYDPNQQQPHYQQPYDPNQQPPYNPNQQQPQRTQRRPPQTQQQGEGFMSSTRSKHFLALASGSLGVTEASPGLVGSARVEFDITRLGFLLGYSNFWSVSTGIQVHQFNAMAGFSFFSTDQITWRALLGVDVMARDGIVGTGPVIGTNLRSMWGRVGVDGAVLATLFPFRQLEARAAFVVNWGVLEAHIGWRLQIIDATQSGTIGTLFTSSPAVNGPVVGIGLTL